MTIKEDLEKEGIYTLEFIDKRWNDVKEQCMEMGQLKSDFDIEKFTVRKEGNFLAHNFHFLMRQYTLALSELRKMLIQKKEYERNIKKYTKLAKKKKEIIIYSREGKREKYTDLYVMSLINELDLLEVTMVNKAMMVKSFELCRIELIRLNGGKAPTNEEYQAECPAYWAWVLGKMAIDQVTERRTGIKEGVLMNIHYLEELPLLNPEYQVKMFENGGLLNFDKIKVEIETRKKLPPMKKLQLESNKKL